MIPTLWCSPLLAQPHLADAGPLAADKAADLTGRGPDTDPESDQDMVPLVLDKDPPQVPEDLHIAFVPTPWYERLDRNRVQRRLAPGGVLHAMCAVVDDHNRLLWVKASNGWCLGVHVPVHGERQGGEFTCLKHVDQQLLETCLPAEQLGPVKPCLLVRGEWPDVSYKETIVCFIARLRGKAPQRADQQWLPGYTYAKPACSEREQDLCSLIAAMLPYDTHLPSRARQDEASEI